MEKHFELTDKEFEKQFEDCTLDASLFTHEAHLRLAWIYITKYGLEQAIKNAKIQIKKYAASLGAAEKYHETITVASIKAVFIFIKKSNTLTFYDFINENETLKTDFKKLLATHYTTDIFNSETAKKDFLEPELDPFD
jgi:hypothetical protein